MRGVGVVGLGAMGWPAVRYLRAAGHEVWCADLDPVARDRAVGIGARAAGPAEVAAAADVVLVFVPSDDDVRTVCLGRDGALGRLRDGAVLAVCSSVRPGTCQELERLAPAGVGVLDAALTGGVRGAEEGRVNLLVGGDPGVLDRVRPVFDAFCSSIHHLGPLGSGQVGKTVNNMVHWAQVAAITEALGLASDRGLDVPTVRRALLDGPVASRTLRELEDFRFTWHVKDLEGARRLAAEQGSALPIAEVVADAMLSITVDSTARLLRPSGGKPAGRAAGS